MNTYISKNYSLVVCKSFLETKVSMYDAFMICFMILFFLVFCSIINHLEYSGLDVIVRCLLGSLEISSDINYICWLL